MRTTPLRDKYLRRRRRGLYCRSRQRASATRCRRLPATSSSDSCAVNDALNRHSCSFEISSDRKNEVELTRKRRFPMKRKVLQVYGPSADFRKFCRWGTQLKILSIARPLRLHALFSEAPGLKSTSAISESSHELLNILEFRQYSPSPGLQWKSSVWRSDGLQSAFFEDRPAAWSRQRGAPSDSQGWRHKPKVRPGLPTLKFTSRAHQR